MSMNGRAQISVLAELSSSTTKKLQEDLNRIAKGLSLNLSVDRSGLKEVQNANKSMEKSVIKSAKNMTTANNKFFQSFQNLSNKTAKQSASVFQEKFKQIGSAVEKSSIGKAIDNIGILSQKNAKQSASVFQASFKEIELNARKMQAAINSTLMPKLSGKSAQASASAFAPMLNNMASNDNKAFNSWFIPRSTTENINSAKASMSAFTSEVSKGATVYDRYGNVNRRVTQQFREQNREMINATRNQFAFGNMLMQGIKKMLIWSATATLLYAPFRAFQRGLATLKEIDTELVNIAKVTDLTKVEMQDLAMKAADVGIEFGRTTQEYLQAVAEFSRGGYGKAAEELGKVTMLLQNVGDVNAETANSFLLATDAAYKLGGSEEKLTDIVSGLNNVSNRNATTVSKVAEGMSVSASMANQAGIGVEELTGAISTMTIVTQRSGAEAGRAFKGILMNLRRIKGESDGEIIDEESMSKAEKALGGVQIPLREMKNGIEELRDPMVILDELAKKWKDLSTVDQSKLIEGLGGVYRGNQFVALMEGWDTYEKTVDEFLNNNNSAIKENERVMESWQAKSKQLSASVSKMWMTTMNTDTIKGFIDGVRSVVDVITKLGGLLPIISGLIGYLFVGAILKGTIAINKMVTAWRALQLTMTASGLIAGGLPLIIGLLTVAVVGYIVKTKDAKKETDAFTEALTLQTRTHKELRDELDNNAKQSNDYKTQEEGKIKLAEQLVDKLYDLSEAYNGNEVDMARMLQIKNKINDLIPTLNIQIDKETGKITNQRTEVDKLIKSQSALIKLKAAETLMTGAHQVIFESKANIQENQKKINDLKGQLGSKKAKNIYNPIEVYGIVAENKKIEEEIALAQLAQTKDQANILDAKDRLKIYEKEQELYTSQYADLIIKEDDVEPIIPDLGDPDSSKPREVIIDQFYKQRQAVEDLNAELLKNERLASNTKDDEVKLQLLKERLVLLEEMRNPSTSPLTAQANAMRSEIKRNLSQLQSQYGIQGSYDDSTGKLTFSNLEKINSFGAETKVVIDDLVKSTQDTSKEVTGLQADWWSNNNDLISSTEELGSLQNKIYEKSFSVIPAKINEIALQAEQYKVQSDLLENEIDRAEKADDYVKAISSQNKLLSVQKNAVDGIKSAQKQLSLEADKVRDNPIASGYDTDKWFSSDGETNVFYQELFASLSEDGQEAIEKVKNALQPLKKEWIRLQDLAKGLTDEIVNSKDAVVELTKESIEYVRDMHKEKVSAIEKGELKIQEIIKKGIDMQKEAMKDELDDYRKLIDDKISEKEREWDVEDNQKRREEDKEAILKLQQEISNISRDTSLSGITKRKKLEEQLAKEIEKMQDNETKRSRDLEKQALQDSLTFKEKSVEDAQKLIDAEWTNERITMEARDALFNKSFDKLRKEFPILFGELQTSSDDFFGTFVAYEKIFGDNITSMATSIYEELLPALQQALDAIGSLDSFKDKVKQASRTGDTSALSQDEKLRMQDIDMTRIRDLQLKWNELNAIKDKDQATKDKMTMLGIEATGIRERNGWEWEDLTKHKSQFSDLPSIGSRSQGVNAGAITKTGSYMLHGTASNPEWVLTNNQMLGFLKNLVKPQTPQFAGAGGGMNLNINVYGDADNGTVAKIKDAGKDILKEIKNNFRKRGW